MILVQEVTHHIDHGVEIIIVRRPFTVYVSFAAVFVVAAAVTLLVLVAVRFFISSCRKSADNIDFYRGLPSVGRLVFDDLHRYQLTRLNVQTAKDLRKGSLSQQGLYPEVGRGCTPRYLSSSQYTDLLFGNRNIIIFVENEIPFHIVTKAVVGDTLRGLGQTFSSLWDCSKTQEGITCSHRGPGRDR